MKRTSPVREFGQQDATPAQAGFISETPVLRRHDKFYCHARRRKVPLHKCLDDYLNANAFNNRPKTCWRCLQGRETRKAYAWS